MNARDSILARIREALRVPAPRPEPAAAPTDFTAWLPPVGASFAEWAAAFAAASRELRTEFHLLEDGTAARAELERLRDAAGWRRIAAHRGERVGPLAEALGLPVLWTEAGYDRLELERCDAGLTECDALVAQTGSVVVTSASAGGRALSVLPPHHVVVAGREQLVPDLPAAFERLAQRYHDRWPSMVSFITGPSRTGDIERILVLGAHGPKQLTVLCW